MKEGGGERSTTFCPHQKKLRAKVLDEIAGGGGGRSRRADPYPEDFLSIIQRDLHSRFVSEPSGTSGANLPLYFFWGGAHTCVCEVNLSPAGFTLPAKRFSKGKKEQVGGVFHASGNLVFQAHSPVNPILPPPICYRNLL